MNESTPHGPGRISTHIVYVHGVGKHRKGYGKCWWKALVCNSKIICDNQADYAYCEVLWNRKDKYVPEADPPTDCRHGHPDFPQNWIELASLADFQRGKADVSEYLAADASDPESFRYEAIDRCQKTIKQVIDLHDDAKIVVISHSMGTVVSFEALHQLGAPPDAIHAWITIGTTLAWPAVMRDVKQRSRPSVVKRWINIMDKNDFAYKLSLRKDITEFYSDVEGFAEDLPVDCDNCHDLPPVFRRGLCAHMHYFHSTNAKVNGDIAGHILQP